jgi:hypothetical protein
MSSTYSTNLALELPGTGEQAGNWGQTNNLNIGTLLEQAISGYVTQAVSTGTDTTLAMSQGASATARNMFIELTGSGGASTNLIVPSNKKLYFIYNNTSAGQVTVKVSGQTGISVANGTKVVLVSNGTDIVNATSYAIAISGVLPVSGGGTGVTTLTGLAYGNGTSAFTAATAAQTVAVIGTTAVTNATNATQITNTGGWNVTPSGTKLYFNYNGTNVASLDSSGNLITLGSHTAGGTP